MSKSVHPHLITPRPRPVARHAAGAFVLGRRAFAKVSAVEGITASPDLEAALLVLEDAEQDARRDVLAEKYGRS